MVERTFVEADLRRSRPSSKYIFVDFRRNVKYNKYEEYEEYNKLVESSKLGKSG
jgi:hypothetical protein